MNKIVIDLDYKNGCTISQHTEDEYIENFIIENNEYTSESDCNYLKDVFHMVQSMMGLENSKKKLYRIDIDVIKQERE